MRNVVIDVLEKKSCDQRSDVENERHKCDVCDVLVAFGFHELVQPQRNVDRSDHQKQSGEGVQQRDLVQLWILQDTRHFHFFRFYRRLQLCRRLLRSLWLVIAQREGNLENNRRNDSRDGEKDRDVLRTDDQLAPPLVTFSNALTLNLKK